MRLAAQRSYARSEAYYRDACQALAGGVNSNFRLHGQPVPLDIEVTIRAAEQALSAA